MSSLPPSVATLQRDGPIAVLIVNYAPVNALGQLVRNALADALAVVAEDRSIAALVIRCDGRTYFAGADIREFGKPRTPPYLPDLFGQIEDCRKPVITAIHGNALGGGLELAMACHFRLATRSAKLGLPEVTLGILPGAGGTQRLPRLIGTAKALDMLTSGGPIDAVEALERGLIDAISDGDLAQDAVAFARAVVADSRPIRRTKDRDEKLQELRENPQMIDRFEAENFDRFRNLDAPPAIFRSIRGLLSPSFEQGIAIERAEFLALREGPQAAALRYTFLAEREAAKVPGVPASVRPQPIDMIGIVGTGAAAADIAVSLLSSGCAIRLVDEDGDALARFVSAIHEQLDGRTTNGHLTPAVTAEAKSLLHPDSSFEALGDVDLIIDAADGPLATKRNLFALIDEAAQAPALLATLGSFPVVEEVAAVTERPDRVFGLHVLIAANPAKLIEVIRGDKTSDMTLVSAIAFAKRIAKTAIIAGNMPGFIGRRMLSVWQRESEAMVAGGVSPDVIDRVTEAFGMAAGPVHRIDRDSAPRPAARGSGRSPVDEANILMRLHYPLINEGARLLEEGVALRASDIDMLWLKAYGWPAWTGGPMFHGERIGLSSLVEALDRLGVTPAKLLVQLAQEQKSFGDL